jgi:uncharacterized surface protein with fasciclin (FAS1) repeats
MHHVIRRSVPAFAAAALALGLGFSGQTLAQGAKTVGGAPMYPSQNIIQNGVNSKDHTTLVTAVKAADLVDTLQTAGPFTVFAPTNGAFAKLPAGTVETLVQPQSKSTLTSVLTYHVVPGRYTAKEVMALAKKGGGEAELKTVQGSTLGVIAKGNRVFVADNKGNTARVTVADVILRVHGVLEDDAVRLAFAGPSPFRGRARRT